MKTIKSWKSVIILSSVSLLALILILPLQSKKERYDSNLLEYMEDLTYHWLSGNSRGYADALDDLEGRVKSLKGKPDRRMSYNLGNAFRMLFTARADRGYLEKLFAKQKDLAHERLHLIYALQYPAYKGFTIAAYTKWKKYFKDYDYLLAGSWQLLRGKVGPARDSYLQGVRKSSKLLSAFDIMMESAEIFPRLMRGVRGTKPFIAGLPYVRAEDAFLYIRDRLALSGYRPVKIKAGSFSISRAQDALRSGRFPVFLNEDLPYLTNGDLFLLCKSILALEENSALLKTYTGAKGVPRAYSDIAGYLLKKRIIAPYIDGRVHVISLISGAEFFRIANAFFRSAGTRYAAPASLYQELIKTFSLKGYSKKPVSPGRLTDRGLAESLAKKDFPLPVTRRGRLSAGDLYLSLRVALAATGRGAILQVTPESVKKGWPGLKSFSYLPDRYRKIVRVLIGARIILPGPDGHVDIERSLYPFEVKSLVERFKGGV